MFKLIGCLLLFVTCGALAAPPQGYNLVFQSQFSVQNWLPLTEWGPLSNYSISEWYQTNEFISHTPYAGDFGYAPFSKNNAYQYYGKCVMNSGSMLASVDTNGNGFSQAAPAYWEAQIQMPGGRDAWAAFWLEDMLSIQRGSRTANESEIDVGEWYGDYINRQEIHTHVWDKSTTQVGGASTNVIDGSSWTDVESKIRTYGCLILPDVTHFYLDGVEVWNTPTLPEMMHPLYVMVDFALQDRSFSGEPWSAPGAMQVQSIRCYVPAPVPHYTKWQAALTAEENASPTVQALSGWLSSNPPYSD